MSTVIHPQNHPLRRHHFPPKPPPPPPHPSLSLPKPKSHHRHLLLSSTTSLPRHTLSKPLIFNDINSPLSLLHLSVQHSDADLAKAVHACSLKSQEDTHLGNSLVLAYLKLGLLNHSFKVFTFLSCPSVVTYSSLISGFAKSSQGNEAIKLFMKMRNEGIMPNEFTFVAILTACIRVLELELGFQVHGLVIKMGFLDRVFVANALMGLYGKFNGALGFVYKMFDEMPHRDVASWNTVISSLVKQGMYEKAFELSGVMQGIGSFRADFFTISTVLSACEGSNALMKGKEVHAHAIRIGLVGNLSVNNALIGFYSKCGSVGDVVALFESMPVRDVITWTEMISAYMEFGLVDFAVEVFDKMPEKNCVSYNALMAGFCRNGEGLKAVKLFIEMVEEGLELTDFSLSSVINACALVMDAKTSEQIHGFCVKFGFRSNACVEAALLDMCMRCGRMADAEKMFCMWPSELDSSVVCTSMLCGYARNGQPDNAISFFLRRRLEGTMDMDDVTLTSVLGVCGTLGFEEMGEQIHCHALKIGFVSDLVVLNSVISMYAKCGNMNGAIKVFNNMPIRDVVSWNALIAGHILHRQGEEALAVWSMMEEADIKADTITLILVILAYRHTNSDLVDNCRKLFLSMKTNYNIEPTPQHYASFVSVLGRWSLLEEAEKMIDKMTAEPKASAWRALLDSCRIHLNTTIGKRVAKHILAMKPRDPPTYILVSNLYSASGRWHCSDTIREDMREKGFRKHPARSWIIHQNKVHSFYARDKSHPQTKDIYSGLEILVLECVKAGYVPDTSFVLHEVEEHQKKDFLLYHSAKLTTTYGLLMSRPGEPIRIVKNILLCGDCHTFLKFVSVVTRREIFLRDASGFHCFRSGQCSCKNYW
ncbi:PREDICTED: pentatricopeptide repeat-containing protein At5g03800 [Theobroma cacao]|uniref:Pentatricopeptide repeat-containing protein At5g03800 n=1 Tax=Theobroma cacao TaxID=3641 RepID=A0AB32WF70_THECC|nr:PREDICTED: pentatricopeptide repeat-containing protein At5g03800 [Theobroma cacao]